LKKQDVIGEKRAAFEPLRHLQWGGAVAVILAGEGIDGKSAAGEVQFAAKLAQSV